MGNLMLALIFRLFVRKKRARFQMAFKTRGKCAEFKKKVQETFWNDTLGFFHQNYILLTIASLINHTNTDYINKNW
jgi:hypothetical protein